MSVVTVSEKYQVVIPKDVREGSRIRPGTKLEILEYGNRIELVPIVDITELKGIYKGIDASIEREDDR